MRCPQGYAIITDPDAPTKECDTIVCCHCQRIVFVRPGQSASDVGGFCRLCFEPTCGPCADIGTCFPFEKQLEAMEARGRLLAAMGS
jgi:hypothetical protein